MRRKPVIWYGQNSSASVLIQRKLRRPRPRCKVNIIICYSPSSAPRFFWSFPFLAGILTLIGLFTPFAIEDGFYSWLWGGNYLEIGGDGYFYWIFELDFQDVTPLIFISNFALFITLLITAIGAIIYSLMLMKKGDFRRFERKWLILGILFIVATTIYLIEFEILMHYYFSEYLSIDASYWEFFDPGFALFAPFISGCITLIGFAINKYVLPKKRDWYFKIQQLCRNIIYILSIGFSFLFLFHDPKI